MGNHSRGQFEFFRRCLQKRQDRKSAEYEEIFKESFDTGEFGYHAHLRSIQLDGRINSNKADQIQGKHIGQRRKEVAE